MQQTSLHPQPSLAHLCLNSCRKLLAEVERVKTVVQDEFRGQLQEHQHLLKLALNEAEALAWQTDFPHLVFPTLAVEKAQAVAQWHSRQRALQQAGVPLLLAA